MIWLKVCGLCPSRRLIKNKACGLRQAIFFRVNRNTQPLEHILGLPPLELPVCRFLQLAAAAAEIKETPGMVLVRVVEV
jgi:hypothetical protein